MVKDKKLQDAGLSGAEKAAVLMVALGDELAAEVLRFLEEDEIQQIGNYMSVAGTISTKTVDRVAEDFYLETVAGEGGILLGGLDYIKKVLEKTMEPWKVQEIIDRISPPGTEITGGGLEAVKRLEPKTIASFLRGEHPQTCAIILSHLEGEHAALVLSELPDKFQTEVSLRVATLDRVSPAVIKELDEALAEEFRSAADMQGSKIGGIDAMADVLNQMDHASETRILSEIEESHPDIAQEIRKLMFIFEDLTKIDDRGIQAILKEVTNEDLLLAMKTASEGLKEKIFHNMSERASQMIKEDLEAMGPVRVSDVEKSQQAILKVAKKLEDEGKIVIGGGGEQLV